MITKSEYTSTKRNANTSPSILVGNSAGKKQIYSNGRVVLFNIMKIYKNEVILIFVLKFYPFSTSYFNYTPIGMYNTKYLYFLICNAVYNKVRFENNPPVHFGFCWKVATFGEQRPIGR
jgi:hypothetical protein